MVLSTVRGVKETRPARLRVGVVGPGRVGAALGAALARAGPEGVAATAGSVASLRRVETIVVEMGGEPVWVPESARAIYHAALSIGANHLVTLVNDAIGLLDGAGVAEPARLIAPLLSAALDNVLRLGDAALTGPVSRGD